MRNSRITDMNLYNPDPPGPSQRMMDYQWSLAKQEEHTGRRSPQSEDYLAPEPTPRRAKEIEHERANPHLGI